MQHTVTATNGSWSSHSSCLKLLKLSRRYLLYCRLLCPPLAGSLMQQSPRHLIDNTACSSPGDHQHLTTRPHLTMPKILLGELLLYIVPLDLKLTVTSIYSRSSTPIHQAIRRCSHVSASCSHAWFYT